MPKENTQQKETKKPICGIVMPISPVATTYSAEHWQEVLEIIKESAENAGFEANLVSYADESGIIQNHIVKNLFTNEIIVCDVSGKNPNVMFELGIRLAADKAAIIIKDDKTDYSFDTGIIEHLGYPSDLNYHKILVFKEKLASKLSKTYEASKETGYSTFIKHFKLYHTPKSLEQEEIPQQELLLKMLDEIKLEVRNQKVLLYSFHNELTTHSLLKDSEFDEEANMAKAKRIAELRNAVDVSNRRTRIGINEDGTIRRKM